MSVNTRSGPSRGPLAALLLALALPASAATFTPNSFDDRIDADPGDGVCATSAPVVCTLRAAVMEANALPGADTISLPAGTYRLTIPGTTEHASLTGDLDILDAAGLTIQAQGTQRPIIDANLLDRALDVIDGPFVLNGVRIINGRAITPGPYSEDAVGGGILLRNPANTFIHLSDIESNEASIAGAGIYRVGVVGTLTITQSRVANNRAGLDGGAEYGAGGGLFAYGDAAVAIHLSRFEGNQANVGGAISLFETELLLRYSVLGNNRAVAHSAGQVGGAGVHAKDSTLRIENSSLYWNLTQGGAENTLRGAITVEDSLLRMFSSTIAENNFCGIDSGRSDVFLQNLTISDNSCGVRWYNLPFHTLIARTLFIRNSALAFNFGANCVVTSYVPDVRDIDGHNLDDGNSCNLAPSGFGNLPNTDSGLDLLDVSLPLPALMPLPGSPLIDAGSPLNPASGNPEACFQFDQLGVEREAGRCDIGAVERTALFSDGFEF